MKEKLFLNYIEMSSEEIAKFKEYCAIKKRTIKAQLELEILKLINEGDKNE